MKGFIIPIFLFIICTNLYSQTYVGGGIYTNTTWTKVNSPYIVVDTIVVFPGDTLTIEPGVTVEFDFGHYIEVRGHIIAIGTANDSITFTSNYISPVPGVWESVIADTGSVFSFCHISYARSGIVFSNHVNNSAFFQNIEGVNNCYVDSSLFVFNERGSNSSQVNYSTFLSNQTGIFYGMANHCIVNSNATGIHIYAGHVLNCQLKYNVNAIELAMDGTIENCLVDSNLNRGIYVEYEVDGIINCIVTNNRGIGIESHEMGGPGYTNHITGCLVENNDTGVIIYSSYDSLYCNIICNNTSYDLLYYGHQNLVLPGNYWCTNDSLILSNKIFDGYDDISYGLVSYFPIDTNGCNLTLNLPVIKKENLIPLIYPNPTSSSFKIKNLPYEKTATINIFNISGQKLFETTLDKTIVEPEIHPILPAGIYYLNIFWNDGFSFAKLIVN